MLELCDLNKMSYEELQALAAATAMYWVSVKTLVVTSLSKMCARQ